MSEPTAPATPLPRDVRDLLAAVLAAIDLPHPATVGDQPRQREVLAERVMHAAITLRTVLRADGSPFPADLAWETAFLHAELAEHPPAGYKTGPWPGVPVDGDQPKPEGEGSAQPPEGGAAS
jgi:hypothetical protein